MIRIEPQTDRDRDVWSAIIELTERNRHWTLIGARMVELLALEPGRPRPRVSLDADALVDVRGRPRGTEEFARLLIDDGYAMDDPAVMGVGFAFRRGRVEIDVLAPDGLNSRDRRRTLPPAYTVEVPGGTQALRRTAEVPVALGRKRGLIRRPDLLGAILLKTRAIEVDDAKENQRGDVALLLSLVREPETLDAAIAPSERRWLRRHPELDEPNAPCWQTLDPASAQNGLAVLRLLRGSISC